MPRDLARAWLEAVAGGLNLRNVNVTVPQSTLDTPGAIDAEHAADLQAAQYLHLDPSLDVVTYDGTGPGNRVVMGSYSRDDYNRDLAAQNFVVRNDEVVSNAEGSVNDRFSGLENPPWNPFASSSSSSPDAATFDERFSGYGSGPSWMPEGFDSGGSGATRSIGEGAPSETYDEASTLSQGSDGSYSSAPAYDDASSFDGGTGGSEEF